jgi:outer membrane phospholipase A
MFWRLHEESTPFQDISFNPELLYRISFKETAFLDSLDLIPYGHKSNGKGGADSRSTEYTAVQLNLRRDFANWPIKASMRVRSFYLLDKTNDDFRKYEGPIEFQFSVGRYGFGFLDKVELATRVFPGGAWGTRWDRGGEEFSLVFRILGFDITPAFYLQYFYGYSESLINYNQKQSHFRVGLLL